MKTKLYGNWGSLGSIRDVKSTNWKELRESFVGTADKTAKILWERKKEIPLVRSAEIVMYVKGDANWSKAWELRMFVFAWKFKTYKDSRRKPNFSKFIDKLNRRFIEEFVDARLRYDDRLD